MTATDTAPDEHRLPTGVVPGHYRIELDVDTTGGGFAGSVEVDVEVREPTSTITMNALDLEVDVAWVRQGGRTLDASVTVLPELERIVLTVSEPLEAGGAEVVVRFHARLGDQLVGLYRSTYTDADGNEHALAVTQFEATHARRCFPCWDEPAHKATFGISVIADEALTVVSNAPEVGHSVEGDGRVRSTFADTMRMSTYLVAVVIGALEVTEPRMIRSIDGRDIPLRVVHPLGSGHLCAFALEIAAFALGWFEKYYDVPYPGDKLDLVAVPDFAFGAMENLGCVTFREVLLLIDPERATRAELERVALVTAHEIAHMWFGDLVTMGWWEGIWLNEAFATHMETSCTDAFRPEWDLWTSFGLSRSDAFDTDALSSTRAIEYPVITPEDAEGMFDVITYEKGGSVLRMLEVFMGPEVFRDGVRRYLRRHAYGNTETHDLWDALEEAAAAAAGDGTEALPVRRVMDAWIHTPGHPLIAVERAGDAVHLRPSPMRPLGADQPADGSSDHRNWPVPVVLRVGGTEHRVLAEGDVSVPDAGGPVLVNAGGSGFYRVAYAPELRRALATDPARLDALERFTLLDDTWAALLAGRAGVDDVFTVIGGLAPAERSVPVWRSIAGALAALARLTDDTGRDRIAAEARRLALPLPDAPPGDTDARERRGLLMVLAGRRGGDPGVAAMARDLFSRIPGGDVDPFEAAAAYDVIAPGADQATYEELLRRTREAETPQEEIRTLYVLADVDDEELFRRTLGLAADEVRTQNAPYLLRRALQHRLHGDVAWAFLEERWEHLLGRFPRNSIPRMIEGVRSFTDAGLAERVAGFLADKDLPGLQTGQHLERMRVNVALAERIGGTVAAALGGEETT